MKGLFKKAFNYAKNHKTEMFQLAVIGVCVVAPDVTFAAGIDPTQGASVGSELGTGVKNTVEKLQTAMTGFVPKAGVTIAAAGAFLNYAIGNENQVTKMATRVAVGGGAAMTAPSLIGSVTGACIM